MRLVVIAAFIGDICQRHVRRPNQLKAFIEALNGMEAIGRDAYIMLKKLLNIPYGKPGFRRQAAHVERISMAADALAQHFHQAYC